MLQGGQIRSSKHLHIGMPFAILTPCFGELVFPRLDLFTLPRAQVDAILRSHEEQSPPRERKTSPA
jgi:hypothetical protein